MIRCLRTFAQCTDFTIMNRSHIKKCINISFIPIPEKYDIYIIPTKTDGW